MGRVERERGEEEVIGRVRTRKRERQGGRRVSRRGQGEGMGSLERKRGEEEVRGEYEEGKGESGEETRERVGGRGKREGDGGGKGPMWELIRGGAEGSWEGRGARKEPEKSRERGKKDGYIGEGMGSLDRKSSKEGVRGK